jgi:hypothetical protein
MKDALRLHSLVVRAPSIETISSCGSRPARAAALPRIALTTINLPPSERALSGLDRLCSADALELFVLDHAGANSTQPVATWVNVLTIFVALAGTSSILSLV